jgi:hypothetical protein
VWLLTKAETKAKSDTMKQIKVDKLVVNICVGESGDRLFKAAKVLQELSDQEPVYSKGILTVILVFLVFRRSVPDVVEISDLSSLIPSC